MAETERQMVAAEEEGHRGKGHNLAVVISWMLGCVMLFPWNALLTINDYYYVVFPNDHPSRVFTIIYEPFGLGVTLIFLYFEARASTRWRVVSGFLLFTASIIFIIVVDLVSHGDGGRGAFIVMCFLIMLFGIADGIVQGGLVGELAYMHPSYMQAYTAGLAASGVVTSGLRMITKAAFGDGNFGLRKGALVFLGLAALIEIIGFLLYIFVFPRIESVRKYREKAFLQGSKAVADAVAPTVADSEKTTVQGVEYREAERKTVKQLMIETWDFNLALVLIYTLSLSIFPGFLYEDTGKHKLGSWYALVLIAMYNAADLLGRYVHLIPGLFMSSRPMILNCCWLRLAFVPAFYFTAKYADAGYMIFLCIMLGLTNGYLTVVVFIRAPRGYNSLEQNAIGNILVVFLLLGLLLGVVSGWLWLIGKGW
ncbi:hypothetical protein MPTK1_5g01910 [Marchantia polymorpha subsp. ruderalis]|uniref:Equilibrative nucleoside transporter n=2 Tax=Marchantia polymorpha TaxID=3197 RepID=A0A176VID0_MARPO|nr:hypothetical protein AXG93_2338s1160 [Marchantia polymorpha subsp. ruderalis]PTQ28510.1 hypothetical protein MARPO_0161s0013 [Marchantia polymorpha]PTQ28511.1 hypothetical protein MARPO_0161s0013 [Marchantia polymorpha]BBN10216.1 hypothetical protein Mp_5g01910 [Marchantia polymorpha subsp. ruderalis]BBN10217.1 hypothetical protein Mp_5g01910 [Marchantia polymorpha subsp. ruderalis]|eukprot:PTQ28510.1 hypothetical protein MARPO_0161s0013 [Marchantia polymorpha]